MIRRFLQYNRYRAGVENPTHEQLKAIVAAARRLSAEADFADIDWALWRRIAKGDFVDMITEEYRSAERWGKAEDFGVNNPDLRAILSRAREKGVAPSEVVLLAEETSLSRPAGAIGLEVVTFAAGTPFSDIRAWIDVRAERSLAELLAARTFLTRVSGPYWDVRQAWLYYAEPRFAPSPPGSAIEHFELTG